MNKFERAFEILVMHEGGLCEDHAGVTKYGITMHIMDIDINGDGIIDERDIEIMTLEDAKEIYNRKVWVHNKYSKLHDSKIAAKVFDLTVNMGPSQSHLILQRAVRACGSILKEDGILGPKTRRTTNSVCPDILLAAIRSEAAGVYRLIVKARPRKYKKYLVGWLSRAYD